MKGASGGTHRGGAALVALLCSHVAFGQPAPEAVDSALPEFDPRDLSGVWVTNHEGTGGYRSLTVEELIPPRTPWGEARYAVTVSGRTTKTRGPGVPPALGNDPIMQCNPEGYPRITFFGRPVEFFHVPGRLLMLFEWQRALREVWLDGRRLPSDPEPAWYGYSVGRWEGDTLVIESTGFDDRAWIDIYGNVFSDQMRLEERWRRVGPDRLEVVFRLEDPKTYTRPWVSNTKVYERAEDDWEILEEICAPMDEMIFNETVRDPAGLGAAAQ